MTDEQKLKQLRSVKDKITRALEDVDNMIADIEDSCKLEQVRGETVSLPDSFSEEKEKFIAP
tara:strand:- start:1046 stop:1231 length:186 start_codon:yes stop_codon:yes gene_type:complete